MRTPTYNRNRVCWLCDHRPADSNNPDLGGLRPWRGVLRTSLPRAKAGLWICETCLVLAAKCLSGLPAHDLPALLIAAKRDPRP